MCKGKYADVSCLAMFVFYCPYMNVSDYYSVFFVSVFQSDVCMFEAVAVRGISDASSGRFVLMEQVFDFRYST